MCQVRYSKATLCSNLVGGPFQTRLPKDKRESFEIPVVSVRRKMCRGGRERGSGRKYIKLCRLHFSMQLWGTCGRCLWSSFWHQVCNKLWQTAEQRSAALNPVVSIQTSGRCLLGTELAVRNCTGHSHYSYPWQGSAPSAISYVVQQPLLKKEKPRQGDAATFLMQRQDKGSKLYHKKSYSSEGEKNSSDY